MSLDYLVKSKLSMVDSVWGIQLGDTKPMDRHDLLRLVAIRGHRTFLFVSYLPTSYIEFVIDRPGSTDD